MNFILTLLILKTKRILQNEAQKQSTSRADNELLDKLLQIIQKSIYRYKNIDSFFDFYKNKVSAININIFDITWNKIIIYFIIN